MIAVLIGILLIPLLLVAGALIQNRATLLAEPGILARLGQYLGHNSAALSPDANLPELRPRVYPVKPALLCAELPRALDSLGWSHESPSECRYHASVRTPLFGFIDDVRVGVEPVGEASAALLVHSSSRVGKGDFGANRRHILDLVSVVERQLDTSAPVQDSL